LGHARSFHQSNIVTWAQSIFGDAVITVMGTYEYATEPTRAYAMRAPRGPAPLRAFPEPKKSPVPSVPAIYNLS
jgi:hypothetical protein